MNRTVVASLFLVSLSLVGGRGIKLPAASPVGFPNAPVQYEGVLATLSIRASELSYFSASQGEEVWSYTYEEQSGVPFVRFPNGDRWLILSSSDLLLAYNSESSRPFFIGADEPRAIQAFRFEPSVFDSTSFLIEGDTRYTPDNLGIPSTRAPWVEGVEGVGVGQRITIARSVRTLFVSIGFVSFDRPELYELNARPQTLRVDFPDGTTRAVTLEDTPNPQRIDLGERVSGISLRIESVYEGERWTDTVINFIGLM